MGSGRQQQGSLFPRGDGRLLGGCCERAVFVHRSAPECAGDLTIATWIKIVLSNGEMTWLAKCDGGEFEVSVEADGRLKYSYGTAGTRAVEIETRQALRRAGLAACGLMAVLAHALAAVCPRAAAAPWIMLAEAGGCAALAQ